MTAADFIEAAQQLRPRTGVVFGSGLSHIPDDVEPIADLPFSDLAGVAAPAVPGHRGRAVLGRRRGQPLLLLLGRLHLYEGRTLEEVTAPIHWAQAAGITRWLLTCAAGSLRPELPPGTVLLLRGHFSLVGPGAWRRHVAGTVLATPYAAELLGRCPHQPQGVYAAMPGPSYETPAEIRALQRMGADAVGMSTAWEAEAAQQLGMEVAACAALTNWAAGITPRPLTHAEVLEQSLRLRKSVWEIIERWLE